MKYFPDKKIEETLYEKFNKLSTEVKVGIATGLAGLACIGALVIGNVKPPSPSPPTSTQKPIVVEQAEATSVLTYTPNQRPTHTTIPTKIPTQLISPTQQRSSEFYWKFEGPVEINPGGYPITQELQEGEILYLVADYYKIGSLECGGYQELNTSDICVYIKQAPRDETINIMSYSNFVPPLEVWLGVANGSNPEQALESRARYLWKPPTCCVFCYDGCDVAKVFIEYENGTTEKFILYPDGARNYLDD